MPGLRTLDAPVPLISNFPAPSRAPPCLTPFLELTENLFAKMKGLYTALRIDVIRDTRNALMNNYQVIKARFGDRQKTERDF